MMNREEFERFYEHIPRTALISFLLYSLNRRVREYEQDPTKPFSRVYAYASVGYVVFQLAHAFARAKRPGTMVFDIVSIICGFIAVFVGSAVIFFSN